MGFLSKLFGNKKDKLNEYISRDGVIIDVRSKAEYDSGTIPGSKHIPVQNIAAQATTIKKWNKPVICVCASGGRSATAAAVLRSKGVEAMNGGAWISAYKTMNE